MEVKKFSAEYADDVADIESRCFSNPWDANALLDELKNACSHIYIAIENGVVAGYIAVHAVCGEADIARVAVLPEYRRMGAAKALLKKSLDDIQAERVFLDVRESNAAAISLYKAFGFKNIGIRKHYYTCPIENAVMMKKEYGYEKEE